MVPISPLESYAECPRHLGLFLEFSLTEPCWEPSLEILCQAKVRLQSLGGVSPSVSIRDFLDAGTCAAAFQRVSERLVCGDTSLARSSPRAGFLPH